MCLKICEPEVKAVCRNLLKKKKKKHPAVFTFDIPLKKSYIRTMITCFCSGLFSPYILVFRGHFACSLIFKNKYYKWKALNDIFFLFTLILKILTLKLKEGREEERFKKNKKE